MNTAGRILIVDDDIDFLEAYRDLLGDEGYVVETAQTEQQAREAFVRPGWSVIILDQKLRGGPGGPDSGLDLAAEAGRLAPEAKVIIATGYAEAESIVRAFALGVYDYLQKDRLFGDFLRVKVRNATEAWRERSLAALDHAKREQEIASTWAAALTEANRNKKGKLLESLMLLLFRTVPGFEHARVNVQNKLEEVDVVVQNNSTDPFWQKEGNYVLVECKNWSARTGVKELTRFYEKIENRFGRAALGFFIALGGYAETMKTEALTRRKGNSLVVLLEREDLDALVRSSDRNATLKAFHARAVMPSKT